MTRKNASFEIRIKTPISNDICRFYRLYFDKKPVCETIYGAYFFRVVFYGASENGFYGLKMSEFQTNTLWKSDINTLNTYTIYFVFIESWGSLFERIKPSANTFSSSLSLNKAPPSMKWGHLIMKD